MGPRKPQRSSSTSNAPSRCTETLPIRPRSHSPQATGRIYLETSFTSLQSCLPSTASSVTNGLYSTTSQSSPLPLTNVLTLLNQRARSTDIPVSIHVNVSRPSRSRLSLNIRPPIVDSFAQQPKIVDLIHDDWLGLAPLASPESLSEVSSISSRASFTTNLDKIQTLSTSYELKTPMVMRRTPKIVNNLSTCADDIRNVRYFQKLGQLSRHLRRPSQNGSSVTNSSSNISFASANSSKGSNEDHSVDTTKCCNIKEECVQAEITTTSGESDEFQSAEEALEHVIEKAGCSEFFGSKSTTTFLETHFDEVEEVKETKPIYSIPTLPATTQSSLISNLTLDPDIISNFAIDLNLDEEHRSLQYVQLTAETSKTSSIDSGNTTRPSSEVKNVTFNPEVININSPKVSPQKPKRPDRWNLRLPLKHKKTKADLLPLPIASKQEQVPKTILCTKRRNSEEGFARTEALPLLSGLASVSAERSSPSFVRRKKYVYPTVTVMGKDDSSL